MEVLTAELESRTDFFKKIGPDAAQKMSKALQNLTGEDIKVEFSSIETFEQNAVSVETNEKCFGSYLSFTCPADTPIFDEGNLEGIVVAVFPVASTRILTELLLRRYLEQPNKEKADGTMRLSAFKEAVNILVLTYITEVANALKVKLQTGVPKFASFRNVELSKPALLNDDLSQDSLVSVGQFNISAGNKTVIGEKRPREPSSSFIKGRFIVVY
jgi:chemotaxis protein CheY-P-specific phosphatase CheC